MKRALNLLLGLLILTSCAQAQEVLDGIYVRKNTSERKPLPYQYLRESDVMWSKTVWRKVDLREKMNLPLYFPTKPMEGFPSNQSGRVSMINLIMYGIKNQGLQAYKESGTDEFGSVLTMKDIEERFGAKETVQMVEDVNTGQMVEKKIAGSFNTADVKQYLIKELWFFDKQRSVMEVRIIGICPIREYFKDDDIEQEDPKYAKIFWIYFPEARKLFANHEVFNEANDAERRSFDDIFSKRIFSGYIYQESNMYDNRLIEEYTVGMEALLEAERVKESIFNFEQELWEY